MIIMGNGVCTFVTMFVPQLRIPKGAILYTFTVQSSAADTISSSEFLVTSILLTNKEWPLNFRIHLLYYPLSSAEKKASVYSHIPAHHELICAGRVEGHSIVVPSNLIDCIFVTLARWLQGPYVYLQDTKVAAFSIDIPQENVRVGASRGEMLAIWRESDSIEGSLE